MTLLHSVAASHASTEAALAALDRQMPADADARLVFTFYGCGHDDEQLRRFLRQRFPNAALMGGSSSQGFVTDQGLWGSDGIGLLLVDDEAGNYGVASGPLGDDASASAESLLQQALAACGCSGEMPELVWIYQAPGREEEVIAGLRRLVGDGCPIIGGSAADDDVSGRWRQLGTEATHSDGLAVAVLFPSRDIGYAFQGGYEPAGPNGIVTGIGFVPAGASGVVTASHGRTILSIDGEPAAAVYNRWLEGRLDEQLAQGGTILRETTMQPIATDAGRIDGVSTYLLVHPESIGADGTLATFRNIEVGHRVYAMRGDRQRLIERAGRVARESGRSLAGLSEPGRASALAGGLVVYCGGCRMAVGEHIGEVASNIAAAFGDAPFIGCFTFGEQGLLNDRNVHGNLMISAVSFAA